MTQKDPVCNMMIDEKNAQHTSEINGQKIIYVLHTVKASLTRTLASMGTSFTRICDLSICQQTRLAS